MSGAFNLIVPLRLTVPVNLEVPDWLIEALNGNGACVGESYALAAAEVVHPG